MSHDTSQPDAARGFLDSAFHALAPRLAAEVDRWPDLSVELPAAWRVKRVVNMINLTTPFGLGLAKVGLARLSRGPRGLTFATGYRITWPRFGAFTIGNVIITGHARSYLDDDPALLRHEEIHSWQYVLLGPLLSPLYAVTTVVSYVRTGDRGAANFLEQQAGLSIGGYPDIAPMPFRQGLAETFRRTSSRAAARFARFHAERA